MADTVASGVQMPDTDYRFQQMTDDFLNLARQSNQAFSKLATDAMGAVSVQMTGMGMIHAQWLGQYAQMQSTITAAAINAVSAVSSDDVLGYVKLGASLANSDSPPTPAYQNMGPGYSGQSPTPTPTATPGAVVLPKGTVITVPAT